MSKKVCMVLLAFSSMVCGNIFGMDSGKGVTPTTFPKANEIEATDNAAALWQIEAGMGYVKYRDASSSDGNTAVGRVALGFTPLHWKNVVMGLEAGVQSGNGSMKIDVAQDVLYQMGGTAISSTVKPMVDLLATLQIPLNNANSVFFTVKGGAAYRQWTFDRDTIPNITQVSPELQAGLGFKISSHAKLVAYYQGIYSGDMDFKAHPINDYSSTGSVKNIPTQQGGFLGIEMAL
jgi:hypothetical protein